MHTLAFAHALVKGNIINILFIYYRNNLTIMDTVIVTGQGCNGEMKFSNRKPGSQSPLTFEMTEKHLKNCESKLPTARLWSLKCEKVCICLMQFLER